MTADVTETMDQDKLLGQFRDRYQALINQNKSLPNRLKTMKHKHLNCLALLKLSNISILLKKRKRHLLSDINKSVWYVQPTGTAYNRWQTEYN